MDADLKPHLSVVIPVYNEEKNVVETVRRLHAFLSQKGFRWECLIVNDGSKDSTEKLVHETIQKYDPNLFRLISNAKNRGKGFAVKQGVLASQGNYVLVTDVDLSAPIKELDKLMAELQKDCDVAIGSRAHKKPGCDVQQSFKRWISGRIFNFLVRFLVLKGLKDTQCGFKCFKQSVARELFGDQKLDGFSFDVEILKMAQKRGYRIREVPVMWRQGKDSRVKFFQDSIKMTRDLFRLRSVS